MPPHQPDAPAHALVRIYQSESAEILAERPTGVARTTVLLLAGLLVSLMLVGIFSRIDRVVSSVVGQVVTVEPTVVLQPLDQSIIKTINVQEGDLVKSGQLLSTLDPTFAAADVNTLQLQIASLDAEIARGEAELAQQPFSYDPDGRPAAKLYGALQKSLYDERQAQFAAQVHAYDEQVEQYRASIVRLQVDGDHYANRKNMAKEIQTMREVLTAKQVESRLQLLQSTDLTVELMRNQELDRNNLLEVQHQLEATVSNRTAFVQQWRAQTSEEVLTARNKRDAAREDLGKAARRQDLVKLEAPDDAVVLKTAKLSVGSVLQPGESFIELALLHSPMEAEIYIDPKEIGFVRPGDRVTIKLDPYQFVEHGSVEGKLRWISLGTFTTPQTGTGGTATAVGTSAGQAGGGSSDGGSGILNSSFYKARVSITRIDLKGVPSDATLVPGMTLTADIHVGTRSVFWYLAGGFVRGFDEAMREP